MIARQRHNLGLTFFAAEQSTVSEANRKRLSTNERELLEATQELADGLAARGVVVPALEEACVAMQQADRQLLADQYPPATQSEQLALAALIRARKNIRQNLSAANSSSATACRTFDHQQRQKLRTPDEKKKQREQKLAESREKLNDLAQRQRKWSDEVKSAMNSADRDQAPPESQPPQNSPSPSSSDPSSSQLAQAQQQMIEELQKLTEQLKKLDTGSDQAAPHSEQMTESMQGSLAALQKEQADQAAERSQQTADQLEQLADHLAAMNSGDFGDRLGHAQRLAQHLAHDQAEMEQNLPGQKTSDAEKNSSRAHATPEELAQQQRTLASQGDMLAELMSRLRADSSEQAPTTQDSLETVHTANPPAEIAQQMHEAASDISSGKSEHAARAVADAARRLDDLAKGLQQLRNEFGQPKLDELIALEAQIASLIEQLDRAQGNGEPTAAESKLSGLEPKLDALATRDARLADAMRQLHAGESVSEAAATDHVPGNKQQVPPGFYTRSRLPDRAALRLVSKALQTTIQEAILAGALLDADDAVPPEYKELVEKYYRELSDDLR